VKRRSNYQNMKGTSVGTAPDHGAVLPSMAFRLIGCVIAPCPIIIPNVMYSNIFFNSFVNPTKRVSGAGPGPARRALPRVRRSTYIIFKKNDESERRIGIKCTRLMMLMPRFGPNYRYGQIHDCPLLSQLCLIITYRETMTQQKKNRTGTR